jgi:hypothetical protein
MVSHVEAPAGVEVPCSQVYDPKCPRCDRSMTYILQIDPQDHVPDGFVKGWGHLTRCDRHPDVLGFIWAESC